MRRDHRPFFIKNAFLKWQRFYTEHFLRPHLESLGDGHNFIKPWYIEVFGAPIEIGEYATIIATSDNKVRLSVWSDSRRQGRIDIGRFGLICPGARISSASGVFIGDNCMIAHGAYITDSDWHDVYNRVAFGKTAPIRIEKNVWIGDSAIICKGVTIGVNSIIGAGAVVVDSVPANSIAAGNPAKPVKQLDPGEPLTTREHWYADPDTLLRGIDQIDRQMLQGNTVRHWLRYLLFPSKRD
ncbi:MAG: acyltransferase [Desulfobacterales bacterium]|nr:MAG: acyltransferase [Desulfobacterales bacterium]